MIKFILNKRSLTIPTKWDEITMGQFIALREADGDIEMLSILSGIDKETLIRFDQNSVLRLMLAISFVNKLPNVENIKEPTDFTLTYLDGYINRRVFIPYVKDIRQCTFGQKIKLQELATSDKSEIDKILDIVCVYAQPFVYNGKFDPDKFEFVSKLFYQCKFLDLYSNSVHYLRQLEKLLKFEKQALEVEPTYEQRVAGIDKFSKFGAMNQINAMAKDNVLRYEKVLEMEYSVVLTHMMIQKEKSEFQRRYSEVMQRKPKRR